MKIPQMRLPGRLCGVSSLVAGTLALSVASGVAQTSDASGTTTGLGALTLLPGGLNTIVDSGLLATYFPGVSEATLLADPTVQRFLNYPYTYNEAQVAGRLVGVLAANRNPALLAALDNVVATDVRNGRVSALPSALDTLAANQYTILPYVTFANTENFFRNIDAHLASVRLGVQGLGTASYTPPTSSAWGPATLSGGEADGKADKNPVVPPPPPSEPRFSIWAVGNGNLGTLDSDTNTGNRNDLNGVGFDFYGGGGIAGIDYKLLPNLAIGLAGAYEYTHIDPKTVTGSAHTQQVDGEFYLTYGGPTGLYLNGIVGGGYQWDDVHRNLLGTTAFSSPQAAEFNTHGELGWQLKVNEHLALTPFGQVLYDQLWQSGAAEKGSIANLNVRHGTDDTLLSVVGGKVLFVFNLGQIRLTNTVWGGWRHEFLRPYYSVDATFRGYDNLGAFETRGARFGHESFTGGVGVDAALTRAVSVTFNYDVQANDSFQNHYFNLGLDYRF